MLAFARLLKIPSYSAVGLLELLWHFAAEYAPQGDVGKYPDERIAGACGWIEHSRCGGVIGGDHGRSTLLVTSFCEAGWLDVYHTSPHGPLDVCSGCPDGPRVVVHNWGVHCPDYVKKLLARKGLTVFVSRQWQPTIPTPNLTKPIPTKEAPPAVTLAVVPPDNFGMFLHACEGAQMQGSETDLKTARALWIQLEFGEQLEACKGITDRVAAGEYAESGFTPLPQNYLKNKAWQRTIRLKQEPGINKQHAKRNEVAKLTEIFERFK